MRRRQVFQGQIIKSLLIKENNERVKDLSFLPTNNDIKAGKLHIYMYIKQCADLLIIVQWMFKMFLNRVVIRVAYLLAMNDFMGKISVLVFFLFMVRFFLAPNLKIWFTHQHTVLGNLIFPTRFIQIPYKSRSHAQPCVPWTLYFFLNTFFFYATSYLPTNSRK